jgi:hypothetical protein
MIESMQRPGGKPPRFQRDLSENRELFLETPYFIYSLQQTDHWAISFLGVYIVIMCLMIKEVILNVSF